MLDSNFETSAIDHKADANAGFQAAISVAARTETEAANPLKHSY